VPVFSAVSAVWWWWWAKKTSGCLLVVLETAWVLVVVIGWALWDKGTVVVVVVFVPARLQTCWVVVFVVGAVFVVLAGDPTKLVVFDKPTGSCLFGAVATQLGLVVFVAFVLVMRMLSRAPVSLVVVVVIGSWWRLLLLSSSVGVLQSPFFFL
jgi:hypothetical protein